MPGPTQPLAGGTGSYLVSYAAVDIGVIAFTAKPLVPVIELILDSLAAPTDDVSVAPTKFVAEDVFTSDQTTVSYPSPYRSSATTSDHASVGVGTRLADAVTASDTVSTRLSATSGTGGAWADGGANWTLSNGNLTATRTGNSSLGPLFVTGTFAYPIAPGPTDYTFSVTINSANVAVGLADAAGTASDLGSNAHSLGVYATGDISYNTWTLGGNIGALAAGDTVTVRVKNSHTYFSKDAGATWAGATNGADPEAETGGVPLSYLGGNAFPIVESWAMGDRVTGSF